MQLDESSAAALQAWARFDAEVKDEVVRAVAGAFAFVASADGQVSESEIERFAALVHSVEIFHALDPVALVRAFRDVGQALLTDVGDGRTRALSLIRAVAGRAEEARVVLASAQIAMEADGRIKREERAALDEIRATLGV